MAGPGRFACEGPERRAYKVAPTPEARCRPAHPGAWPVDQDRLHAIVARLRDDFGRNSRQADDTTWQFEVLTEAGRSQAVTLYVKRIEHDGKDLSRLIAYSPIGPVGASLHCERILRKNSELDVGSIAIEDVWTRDDIRIPFVVFRVTHLISTADYAEVWELVTKTGEYADQLEKTVYSRDLY